MQTRFLSLHALCRTVGVHRSAVQTAVLHGKIVPAAVLVVPTGEQPLFTEGQIGDLVRSLQPARRKRVIA